jgi:hypothetical protein
MERLGVMTSARSSTERFGSAVSAIAEVEDVYYVALADGRVNKYQSCRRTGPRRQQSVKLLTTEQMDEMGGQGPYNGLCVAMGVCFVSECCTNRIHALDADDLSTRCTIGACDLTNPLGICWHRGLLWVANGEHTPNLSAGAASEQAARGRLIAFAFDAPGPRKVHEISGFHMPVGIASAHGRLYVSTRDDRSIHVLKVDGQSQAKLSREALTLQVLTADRPLYGLAVHPELPVIMAMASVEDPSKTKGVEVFWGGGE